MKVRLFFILLSLGLCLTLCGCDLLAPPFPRAEQQKTPIPASTAEAAKATENSVVATEPAEPFTGSTWQEAYLKIVKCDPKVYLVDPLAQFPTVPDPSDSDDYFAFLGIHDFDQDGIPELIIGNLDTLAVFSFADGQAEKLADLYYPEAVWCINGVFFKENSLGLQCNGSGGNTYVNFGFLDGQYVLGLYSEVNGDHEVIINGAASTLEEMNRIYTTDFESIPESEYRERLRVTHDGKNKIIQFESGEIMAVDSSFDFNRFLWE